MPSFKKEKEKREEAGFIFLRKKGEVEGALLYPLPLEVDVLSLGRAV